MQFGEPLRGCNQCNAERLSLIPRAVVARSKSSSFCTFLHRPIANEYATRQAIQQPIAHYPCASIRRPAPLRGGGVPCVSSRLARCLLVCRPPGVVNNARAFNQIGPGPDLARSAKPLRLIGLVETSACNAQILKCRAAAHEQLVLPTPPFHFLHLPGDPPLIEAASPFSLNLRIPRSTTLPP
eukprot:5622657-Pleurochrysis_carterae.AAC.2